ncbi:MAG: hypothetical protein OQJ81_02205 [Melioribacteraceae bacterium]|jgi:hypothetical protein|nr:hypothetical protein [Melioribacteraceae bacterium]
MKKLIYLLIVLLSLSFAACSEDDDNGTDPNDDAKPWVGTWLSADANVAPILVSLFKYDSVRVTLNEDKTVVLESHIKDGAWGTLTGVYNVTEAASGDIHAISINYQAFEQEGIVQVTAGNPDQLKLEAVQTVPDIGAVPRTAATGFGSDPALGTLNIQTYLKVN